MYNRKLFKLIILVILFFSGLTVYANENPGFAFGINGGYGISYIEHFSGDKTHEFDPGKFYSGGLTFEKHLSPNFSFSTGIDYFFLEINGEDTLYNNKFESTIHAYKIPLGFDIIIPGKILSLHIPLGGIYMNIVKHEISFPDNQAMNNNMLYFTKNNQFAIYSGIEFRFHTSIGIDYFISCEAEYYFKEILVLQDSNTKDRIINSQLKTGFIFRTY